MEKVKALTIMHKRYERYTLLRVSSGLRKIDTSIDIYFRELTDVLP